MARICILAIALVLTVQGCTRTAVQRESVQPATIQDTAVVRDIVALAGTPRDAYTDADPVARASVGVEPGARSLRLRRVLSSDPGNVAAHVEFAYLLSLQGDRESMEHHYARAKRISGAAKDYLSLRRILWSEGWSRFNVGDYPGAIQSWKISASLHRGAPFWQPYSYAVALWSAGQRDAALLWFGAAVASDPPGWGTEAGTEKSIAHWQPRERAAMRELFAAYATPGR